MTSDNRFYLSRGKYSAIFLIFETPVIMYIFQSKGWRDRAKWFSETFEIQCVWSLATYYDMLLMISASFDTNKSCELLQAYSAFRASVHVERNFKAFHSPPTAGAYKSLARTINCYPRNDNGERAIILPHADSRMETHFPREHVKVPFAVLAKVRAKAELREAGRFCNNEVFAVLPRRELSFEGRALI